MRGRWEWKAGALVAAVIVAGATVVGCAGRKAEEKAAQPRPLILSKLLLSTDAYPDSGDAPLEVQFSADVYAGDEAQNPEYEWDFGDGSKKSKETNPLHTYKKPGEYRAVVTVRDDTGREGRDELEISVEEPASD